MKKLFNYLLLVIILAGLAVAGYSYLRYEKAHPSTGDAYVKAHVINMAAQVSGTVESTHTSNHSHVEKDAVLFTIDPRAFQIAVNRAEAELGSTSQNIKALADAVHTAEANVAEQQAQLSLAKKQNQRYETLVNKGLVAVAEADKARTDMNVAQAAYDEANSQLAEAKQHLGNAGRQNATYQAALANLNQAKLNLSHTKIYAPSAGQVVQFTLRKGSIVTAQQPLFAIIEDNSWWIEANFKETQLANIKPGQGVTIKLDIYPKHTFQGRIISISRGSGSEFSLLPPENATGNWVKVTQRFPVKISITNPDQNRFPLRVGASASVTINTGHSSR